MSGIQNNSALHRNWLSKENPSAKKCGATAHFEYAVQPDGSCYAERQWEELRQISSFSFVNVQDPSVDRRLYQTLSLSGVQTSHQALRRSYRESQELPARPAEAAAETETASTLSTIQEPQHASDAPFLSPTRRIRNRHNAVFGQHLPNALNSPACAAKVFGETSAKKEERARCQNLLNGGAMDTTLGGTAMPSTSSAAMETDDVDDSIFLDLDVDQLVAQRETSRQTQSSEAPFDYGNDWENNSSSMAAAAASRGGNSNVPPSSSRFSNGTVSTVSNETASTASRNTSFGGFGERDSYGSFNGSYNDSGYGGNNNNNNNNSRMDVPRRDSSFATNTRESYSSFTTAREGSFATTSESQGAFTTANNFANSNSSSYNNPFGDDSYGSANGGGTMDDGVGNASGAPLCPGHGRPCRLLTASTATNMGRQFYKCPMPEGEQCDFFEWADGMQGNLNPPDDSQYGDGVASSAGTGTTMDIFRENRRIFGHHSFRPGQQEVIEHAVNGRDVFVLMPTGGGKSLCYQLPACCCPGLSVVISPLLSLIQDQVQSLTKCGVDAVFLNSSQDYETEQRVIMSKLSSTSEHGGVKLLYITPEKLSHSGVVKNILQRLYSRGLISRFVVDEAHCLSDWGEFCGSVALKYRSISCD